MVKRGRKSLADRLAGEGAAQNPALLDETRRLLPVAGLTPAERKLWVDTVYGKPPTWFGQEHAAMLRMYVHAGVMIEKMRGEINKFIKKNENKLTERDVQIPLIRLQRLYRQEVRAFTQLARGMRLTHQSAFGASGNKPQRAGAVLEEMAAKANPKDGTPSTIKRPWEH